MINRIRALMEPESRETWPPTGTGFALNPLGSMLQGWQAEIYQEAFRQAQKSVSEADDGLDFPWAESWN